jgi:hypothetical protein
VIQISGYYFVYLITERDLRWHLDTSNLWRFVQLWPSVLFLIFMGCRRSLTNGNRSRSIVAEIAWAKIVEIENQDRVTDLIVRPEAMKELVDGCVLETDALVLIGA